MFSQVRAAASPCSWPMLGADFPVEVQQASEPADLVEEPAEKNPVVERGMADELRLRRFPDGELKIDLEQKRIRFGGKRGLDAGRLDRVLDHARQDHLAEIREFRRLPLGFPRIGEFLPAPVRPQGEHHADEDADHVHRKRNEEIRHPIHEATTLAAWNA